MNHLHKGFPVLLTFLGENSSLSEISVICLCLNWDEVIYLMKILQYCVNL